MMQFILVSLIFLKLCCNLLLVDARSVFSLTDVPSSHFYVHCVEGRKAAHLLIRYRVKLITCAILVLIKTTYLGNATYFSIANTLSNLYYQFSLAFMLFFFALPHEIGIVRAAEHYCNSSTCIQTFK